MSPHFSCRDTCKFLIWLNNQNNHCNEENFTRFQSQAHEPLVKGILEITSQWRHNGRDSVSNHQLHDCLLNRLFRRRSKKTSKLSVTGLCAGNSPLTSEFPAQRASDAENVSIWWRHHDITGNYLTDTPIHWVYPIKYVHSFVMLCLFVVMPLVISGFVRFIYPYFHVCCASELTLKDVVHRLVPCY